MMSYTLARGLKQGEAFEVPRLCRFTGELGLRDVDWITTYGHQPSYVRKVMDDHGLKTCCYTFFCDLNFPTSKERSAGRDQFKLGVDTALALGADGIMLPVAGKKMFTREMSFRNTIDGLKECIACADANGVTTTIENFPAATSPFISSADVNRAVGELPQLRITYDNGNVTTAGESAYDGFANSAKWIVHAHFKDWEICAGPPWDGASPSLDGLYRKGALVGEGVVDQLGSLRAMKEYEYAGCINFEYEGNKYDPWQATRLGVDNMRKMMATLGIKEG